MKLPRIVRQIGKRVVKASPILRRHILASSDYRVLGGLQEARGITASAGGWLAARGIGPGDVVAVLMKNSSAFLELAFATSHIGAVFLPINYRLSADEAGYIVGNSDARILIADDEFAGIATGGAQFCQRSTVTTCA